MEPCIATSDALGRNDVVYQSLLLHYAMSLLVLAFSCPQRDQFANVLRHRLCRFSSMLYFIPTIVIWGALTQITEKLKGPSGMAVEFYHKKAACLLCSWPFVAIHSFHTRCQIPLFFRCVPSFSYFLSSSCRPWRWFEKFPWKE